MPKLDFSDVHEVVYHAMGELAGLEAVLAALLPSDNPALAALPGLLHAARSHAQNEIALALDNLEKYFKKLNGSEAP